MLTGNQFVLNSGVVLIQQRRCSQSRGCVTSGNRAVTRLRDFYVPSIGRMRLRMAPTLLDHHPNDLAGMTFWQLRGLYTRLVLSGAPTEEERQRLAEVVRCLDGFYGPDWRSGGEPTFH